MPPAGMAAPFVHTPVRPAPQFAGSAVGYAPGAFGGSFCGPTGSRASATPMPLSSSPNVPMPQSPQQLGQSVVVRRLNSQPSASQLSMQPPATTSGSPPPLVANAVPQGLPAAYTAYAAARGPQPGDSAASAGGPFAAEEVPTPSAEAARRAGQFQPGGNAELLQAEAESLRRSVSSQEDRISQLTKELQASRDNERKLASDLEAATSEVARLREEVRYERLLREQADAAATEARLAAEVSAQAAGAQDKSPWQTRNGGSPPGRRPPQSDRGSADRGGVRGKDRNIDARVPDTSLRSSPTPPNGSMPSGRQGSGPPSAKDEIDGRLHEFLERNDCGLLFRRLNRGWYSFRCKGDRGPASGDRSVEISIVNGKLMARLEPSTHDNGWNNGKLGTVERFVAAMTA